MPEEGLSSTVRVPRVRPTSALLVVAFASLVIACATLGPRIQGHDDVVEWRATDLRLERSAEGQRLWTYSFNLAIRELRGTSVTFDQISLAVYQPGVTPYTARYRGAWTLGPKDEFRIPLHATLYCQGAEGSCASSYVPVPLWQVVMLGKDGVGQTVKTVIDLSLPADPPAAPQTTSTSVREIRLR